MNHNRTVIAFFDYAVISEAFLPCFTVFPVEMTTSHSINYIFLAFY